MKKIPLLASVASLSLLAGSVQAVTLATPDADAYVEKSSATTNHGTKDHLRVKNQTGGGTSVRKSYIRYDLSSLAFDHTTDLASASIDMTFFDGNLGNDGTTIDWTFQVYGLNDGDSGEGWGETTINWNNAPQNDTSTGNGLLAGVTSLGTFNFIGRTQTVNFTGGTAVRDFVSADTNDQVTFIVVRDTVEPDGGNSYIHYMGSKENVGQPNVMLNLNQVPEPSAFLLGTLGLLGLAARRRR